MALYETERVREYMKTYHEILLLSGPIYSGPEWTRAVVEHGRQVPEELRDDKFRTGLRHLESILRRFDGDRCEGDVEPRVIVSDQRTKSE